MSERRRSGLYVGTVRHRRLAPKANEFQYRVYQLLLDLDELHELDGELRLLSHNRFNLTAFHDADHMGRSGLPVREKLARWLAKRGVRLGAGPVLLLTNPRVLGYVFNPVSYFFCLDDDGDLRFVVAEVNNTFGETYCYLLDDGEPMGGRAVRSRRDKVFHVSPFISMENIRYDWILTPPDDHITVHIDEYEGDEKFFDATLNLKRRPLTDGSLARAILRHPHLTVRTMYLIHRQALRLWLKRVPVYRKPEPPANDLEAA